MRKSFFIDTDVDEFGESVEYRVDLDAEAGSAKVSARGCPGWDRVIFKDEELDAYYLEMVLAEIKEGASVREL